MKTLQQATEQIPLIINEKLTEIGQDDWFCRATKEKEYLVVEITPCEIQTSYELEKNWGFYAKVSLTKNEVQGYTRSNEPFFAEFWPVMKKIIAKEMQAHRLQKKFIN